MNEIKQRDVFYISGYDPRGYRYYYSLYKRNSKKQNKINNLNVQLSKTKKVDENIFSCEITTNDNTNTNYNFLLWNDIVKENWTEGFFSNFLDTVYSVKMYLFSGILLKFAKESKVQLIAGLYPLLYLMITFSIITFISYEIYQFTFSYVPNYIAVLTGIVVFFLGIKIIDIFANKTAVFWLSRIYAFCARLGENKISKIDTRIEYFSEHIFKQIKETNNKDKEFILSAHSVGTILAIVIANSVIKKCIEANIDYKNFKLLTLGHCIPLVSFQKKSENYKKVLKDLGKTKDFIWLDYTAAIDGACFCIDPIKSAGIKREKDCGPVLMSPRFFKLFKKENYKKIKKEKYKAHFLYLNSTDLLGTYDYFDITAGNKTLEYRILNYMKEN
jgi:hypothetical protein